MRFSVEHSISLALPSELSLTLGTFGSLPERVRESDSLKSLPLDPKHIHRTSGDFVALGSGIYQGGLLDGAEAYAIVWMKLAAVPA